MKLLLLAALVIGCSASSHLQQSAALDVDQSQQSARDEQRSAEQIPQQKSQIDDEDVNSGANLQSSPQLQQSQSSIFRSPSLPEVKVKQQAETAQQAERDVIFPQVLTGQRRLTEPVEDVPKKQVSVQSVESLISSGVGYGGVSHQQIIPQSVPAIREQSVFSQQVPLRVQVVQQQPFVSYSQLGLGPVVQQREYHLSSGSGIGGSTYQQIIPQSVPVIREQSVSPIQAGQKVQVVQQQASPFVSYGQSGPVVQQKEYQLSSGQLGSGSVYQKDEQQNVYSQQAVPQRGQVVQQQELSALSYGQYVPEAQQREYQVPSVSSLLSVPTVQQQQQLVNQVVRQQVQPIYQNLRSQPLSPQLEVQRQYVQTLVQPSSHQFVYQPQSVPYQLTPLKQLVNPYQGQYILQVRQWPEWSQQHPLQLPLQQQLGSSQLVLQQPLQYSGAHDHSLRRSDDGVGYGMSLKRGDSLKLLVDQQSEPKPGLYGHQFGTKSAAPVYV